jgi:two-component system chemotaxis response regulator CheB
MSLKPVKVLIVEDSLIMRELLREILSEAPGIVVVGAAEDGLAARDLIRAAEPDVVTLDIDMPRMDGLEFLRRLMRLHPLPAVVISSHVHPGDQMTIEALEMGAVDCIRKPGGDETQSVLALAGEIVRKVRSAATADMAAARIRASRWRLRHETRRLGAGAHCRLIGIGASMGGVQALCRIVPALPADMPPIVVAQHMPAGFTRSFADRLGRLGALRAIEAADGMRLDRGRIYLAPGGSQLTIVPSLGGFACRVMPSGQADRHAPSIDRLLGSMAKAAGRAGLGVLLTGMGRDGAEGLLELRRAGALTVCQNRESSLVYGMPKAAADLGAVERELSLAAIPGFLIDVCWRPRRRQGARAAREVLGSRF